MPASVPTAEAPVLSVRNLIKHYESRRRFLGGSAPSVLAVDDISFDIQAQETLGLPIVSWLPDDSATLNQALNQGRPLVQTARRAKITRRFDELAQQLNGQA